MNRTAFVAASLLVALAAGCSAKSEASSAPPSGGASMGASWSGGVGDAGGAESPDAIATDDAEPEPGFDRSIQAGLLTAGTFDDTLNGGTFAAFMQSMTAWSAELAPFAAPMSVLRLVDERGHAVPGVAVRVHGDGRGKRLVSGTDGRIVMFPAFDGADATGGVQFRIESDGRGPWRSIDAGAQQTVTLARSQTPAIRALDIALVIDATGSMGDEIEYLKVELRSIASSVSRAFPDVDQRYAVIVYRDQGDDYVTRTFDFTADLRQFERQLGRQRADGGGDYPEAMHIALADAAELSWRDTADTARIAFVVADAPPHDQDVAATFAATEQLRAQGVGIYPVAASGVAAEAEAVMRASAAASGGQYVFLTDDSGVGNPHEEPHIPCYAVEALRDAMIRMVHTELLGARVEVDPKRATRFVGQSQDGVCAAMQRAG